MKHDILDATIILRASQSHMRPEHPEVEELIKKELLRGTNLLSPMRDAYLLVGDKPIEAVQLDQEVTVKVTIEPKTELAIEGTIDNEESEGERVVVLRAGDRTLHILPKVLASTLMQGGVILSHEDDSLLNSKGLES